jgi:hypothetical protein
MEVVMRRQRILLGAIAAILISLPGAGASAEEMHGITCIVNATDDLIAYEISYGSDGFSPQHLAAGYEMSHTQLASNLKPITIRYDADLRPGKANRTMQEFGLKSRSASGKSCVLGHRYKFAIDKVTTLLKLYDESK